MFYPYLKTRPHALKTFWVVLLGILAGCSTPVEIADNYIAQEEWMKAVLELRKATAREPGDVEYKLRLKRAELRAADFYYRRGLSRMEQDDLDGALTEFQQGIAAMPDNDKLQQAMKQVLQRKEAGSLYLEALHLIDAGKQNDGYRLLKRAVDVYPNFIRAGELLAQLEKQYAESSQETNRLQITSHSPITLNFRQTDVRTAFEFIAKSFGIDVVFDAGVKATPITLFAKDVTFEQALNLILSTTKTFYKKVGPNTILVAPDTKEKRGQYEDQVVRVFQLNSIPAKEMADILKSVVPVKKVIINDQLNAIIVRDTEEAIEVASKVIEANDRRPAELVLEVEILEVNRTKAERLGLDLSPYRVTAALPSPGTVPLTGSIQQAFQNNAVLTLPSATLNFYKQDVDAKTLANPRVRVLSGKSAKIHIGDRVPLRASTIQEITSQIRTTYEYKEIGIRLVVEPVIHLDNSVTVKAALEVSSLGQNLGTQTEPAYSIGTRNAETFMLLRDGETAILGGLLRDEDREARVRVPFLGDIPAVGAIFASKDNTTGSTDVLLTITPRVVRAWDMPAKDSQMFTSGSEERIASQALFGSFATPVLVNKSATSSKTGSAGGNAGLEPESAKTQAVLSGSTPGEQPVLAFSDAVYESAVGKEFELKLTGDHLDGATGVAAEVQFNPQYMKYLRKEPGTFEATDFTAEADEAQGVLRIKLSYPENAPVRGSGVLAGIVLRGEAPGTSYVVYRSPQVYRGGGESAGVQLRAARVVIK